MIKLFSNPSPKMSKHAFLVPNLRNRNVIGICQGFEYAKDAEDSEYT